MKVAARKILHSIFLGLAGFIVGFVTNDVVNFRTSQRELLKAEFSQTMETAKLVDKQLGLLSAVAVGNSKKNPELVKQLEDNVRALFADANSITKRVPKAKQHFDEYSDAMVQLKDAAENLSGPADGKQFVEAVSVYYVAKEHFEQAIIDNQGSYFIF
jgi:Na+-transporting NADH:ubiquinone oxidoreductase subunit NqrC